MSRTLSQSFSQSRPNRPTENNKIAKITTKQTRKKRIHSSLYLKKMQDVNILLITISIKNAQKGGRKYWSFRNDEG
ncbi:hypothetical protein GCM10011338_16970 [Alteromonas lipolytica]|nr:hypothetical protein GCM10011338_16970 [Alteromonas lipolytica]